MSSRLGAKSTRALVAFKEEFFAVVVGAILLTIIGDTVMEALTSRAFWRFPEILFRLVLLTAALVILYFGTGWLARLLEARQSKGRSEIKTEPGVDTSPALVLFVSANPNGPFRDIVDRFLQVGHNSEVKLQRVYLIHSDDSANVAEGFETDLREQEIEVERDGLVADFADLKSTRDAVLKAVRHAKIEPELQAITVDVTGGSGICTAGAVLARMEMEFNLTYIRPVHGRISKDGVLQRVDVDWTRPGLLSRRGLEVNNSKLADTTIAGTQDAVSAGV